MYTSENYKTKKKGGVQIGKRGGGYLTSYKEHLNILKWSIAQSR